MKKSKTASEVEILQNDKNLITEFNNSVVNAYNKRQYFSVSRYLYSTYKTRLAYTNRKYFT